MPSFIKVYTKKDLIYQQKLKNRLPDVNDMLTCFRLELLCFLPFTTNIIYCFFVLRQKELVILKSPNLNAFPFFQLFIYAKINPISPALTLPVPCWEKILIDFFYLVT